MNPNPSRLEGRVSADQIREDNINGAVEAMAAVPCTKDRRFSNFGRVMGGGCWSHDAENGRHYLKGYLKTNGQFGQSRKKKRIAVIRLGGSG